MAICAYAIMVALVLVGTVAFFSCQDIGDEVD